MLEHILTESLELLHIPSIEALPAGLMAQIKQDLGDFSRPYQDIQAYFLYPIDLDEDGVEDYLLIEQQEWHASARLYYKSGEGWERESVQFQNTGQTDQLGGMELVLRNEEPGIVELRWGRLNIGSHQFHVIE